MPSGEHSQSQFWTRFYEVYDSLHINTVVGVGVVAGAVALAGAGINSGDIATIVETVPTAAVIATVGVIVAL